MALCSTHTDLLLSVNQPRSPLKVSSLTTFLGMFVKCLSEGHNEYHSIDVTENRTRSSARESRMLPLSYPPDKHSYGVVFHTHRFAAFCELTAVTIEGKQLDHISRNVREVPFRRAQRVSLNRRYGESNQVVLHVSRGCCH